MNTQLVARGEPNRMSQMSPEIQFSPGPWFHEPIAATFQPRAEAFFFALIFPPHFLQFYFILRHVAGKSPTPDLAPTATANAPRPLGIHVHICPSSLDGQSPSDFWLVTRSGLPSIVHP